MTIDVGFGEPQFQHPTRIAGTDLLTFAGIDQLEIPALALEQHVAEKVHAYTRIYAGGRRSSRSKDLVDLLIIQNHSSFVAGESRSVIDQIFRVRGSQQVPTSLPPPPPDWRRAYLEYSRETGIPAELHEGFRIAAAFLDPILSGGAPAEAT